MALNIFKFIDDRKMVYFDQAVVSGTNFVTALILARVLGLVDFGVYSLFFIILIFVHSVHHSLFAAPMLVIAPKISDDDSCLNYLFTLNGIQIIFSLLLSLIACIVGIALSKLSFLVFDTSILVPFGICIFFTSMHEWLRRFFFVTGMNTHAFFLDLTKCILQIGCLLGLICFDLISVRSTYIAIACSSISTCLFFTVQFRIRMQFSSGRKVWLQNWQQGMYLLPVNMMEWVNSQGFIVLASFALGPLAVGAIKAAQNVVGPLNILYQAVENIFPVEGAKRLMAEGQESMLSYFKKVSVQSLFYFGFPCILMAVFAKQIMTIMYGETFSSYYLLVIFHLVSLLFAYYYKILSSLLRVLELSRIIFLSMTLGTVIILFFSVPVAFQYAENGVMVLKNCADFLILIFLLLKIRCRL